MAMATAAEGRGKSRRGDEVAPGLSAMGTEAALLEENARLRRELAETRWPHKCPTLSHAHAHSFAHTHTRTNAHSRSLS